MVDFGDVGWLFLELIVWLLFGLIELVECGG